MTKGEERFAADNDEVSSDVKFASVNEAWFIDVLLHYDVLQLLYQVV